MNQENNDKELEKETTGNDNRQGNSSITTKSITTNDYERTTVAPIGNDEPIRQSTESQNDNSGVPNLNEESDNNYQDNHEGGTENEENFHEKIYKQRHQSHHSINHNHQHRHHHHHHDHNKHHGGRVKELIKPDATQKLRQTVKHSSYNNETAPIKEQQMSASDNNERNINPNRSNKIVATVVDEEQLHKRFIESKSSKLSALGRTSLNTNEMAQQFNSSDCSNNIESGKRNLTVKQPVVVSNDNQKTPSKSSSSSTSSSNGGKTLPLGRDTEETKSPPPAAIIIPANVAKSLSARKNLSNAFKANQRFSSEPRHDLSSSSSSSLLSPSRQIKNVRGGIDQEMAITREQLDYGPLLKQGEVQVLFRNPELDTNIINRHLKEEQAKLVAPNMKQSPISIMTMNPTYELLDKPLIIEYPAIVENLRLNNTGFSWEVKIPYQISMTTALHGAHLNTSYRYRLDNLHCHWGSNDNEGSEHSVDNKYYSAEIHLVHYNMEKYHSMSKAARHPDGLVVLSVFLDAQDNYRNHAELDKIVNQLKSVNLKGEHAIIKQAVRIENLLPANKSYWSYQGSMTTPPFFESVTWFILKNPIKCSTSQIQKFRNLKSSIKHDEGTINLIKSNHRKTQPLNGRTIVNYDENNFSSSHHHHQHHHHTSAIRGVDNLDSNSSSRYSY